jgi:CBS domain-containing protein
MKAREIMIQPVVSVREDSTLDEVARTLLERRIGGVPVIDDRGRLCGLVTESDFAAKDRGFPFSTFRYPQVLGQWLPKAGLERIYQTARTMTAREIMTADVITVHEEDSLEEILRRMLRHEIHRLPVVRDGVPVGIITRHDLLRLMLRADPAARGADAPCGDQ